MSLFELLHFVMPMPAYVTGFTQYDDDGYPIEEDNWDDEGEIEDEDYNDDLDSEDEGDETEWE